MNVMNLINESYKQEFTPEEVEAFVDRFSQLVERGETCAVRYEAVLQVGDIPEWRKEEMVRSAAFTGTQKVNYRIVKNLIRQIMESDPALLRIYHLTDAIDSFFHDLWDIFTNSVPKTENGDILARQKAVREVYNETRLAVEKGIREEDKLAQIAAAKAQIATLAKIISDLEKDAE